MPKRIKFPTETTAVGVQYVIPGAERTVLKKTKRPRYAADGDQLVLPGAERISTGLLLARRWNQPLKPRVGQISLNGTGLFGSSRR
ncbi:MAG: hypothetical protein FJX59_13495 [Alphaproteobacteria bacterium]|nr:hypothetical protein [Alphaproteobacteria bacterium]